VVKNGYFQINKYKVRKKLATQFSESDKPCRASRRRKLQNGRMVSGKGLARDYPDIINHSG